MILGFSKSHVDLTFLKNIARRNLSQPRKIRIYLYQTLLEVMRLETCLNDENIGPQGTHDHTLQSH